MLQPISSLLGYRRGDLLAAIADRRSPPALTVRDTYISAVVDLAPGHSLEMSETTVLHLADCITCGESFAARARTTTRNGFLHAPTDPRHTTATESAWGSDCRGCRNARLNRERVARHRALHRTTPDRIACGHCGAMFQPARSTARFCSGKCRAAAHRAAAAPGPR